MENHRDFGKLIQGLNKGLEPGGIYVFPLLIPGAIGNMIMGAQNYT
jgi:hypothetical protein